MQRRTPTAEKYVWILTAEPPVCGRSGPSLRVLQTCPRLRREQHCFCRFDAGLISADLESVGATGVAEWFSGSLEPDDISDLVRDLERVLSRTIEDEEVAGRLRLLLLDLKRLEENEAGLTDEYSDDLD